MELHRSSGLLLHPTSLPGPHGIGDLGAPAYRFVDFLAASGQRLWQVLPLGPTGYADSPYQSFSAFAGNPLLISLELLEQEGLLTKSDLAPAAKFPTTRVDYGGVIDFKKAMLLKAFSAFRDHGSIAMRKEFGVFCDRSSDWLPDFALFMAVKAAHQGAPWVEWDRGIARRHPSSVLRWQRLAAEQIETHKFWQFLFDRQWTALRNYCRERRIQIIGDMPIYVAHDSTDVWIAKELFHLDKSGRPTLVAGVPPDAFSDTGQLWGNPIYRWDVMASNGYEWWIRRFHSALSTVDIVRIDHFRGFEAYWEVAGDAETAQIGQWTPGPGPALFQAMRDALGDPLPIVAENLGVITSAVEDLRVQFGFPGMAVLQFGLDDGDPHSVHLPHNYPHRIVVYTGTHDNHTSLGWWEEARRKGDEESGPSPSEKFARAYLNLEGDRTNVPWSMIHAVSASQALWTIVPLQDVLGLGTEARMNTPGQESGNWQWRFEEDLLTDALAQRLAAMTFAHGRG
ncbi:4-alpha-glucanotransferase [Planctomycetes bacterium Pan216]|uniref:4-alpha-glucanotransferase n=1 Tax=Kolteria novifilia TaxID=2527975 RepID=A0A518AZF8_9BACT|nr:4-alpha-glucanotransferase [Planctomycetes bacterium Pan216]